MRKLICSFSAIIAGFMMTANASVVVGDWNVIPLPQTVTLDKGGAPFIIKPSTTIVYANGDAKMQKTAEFLASYIKDLTGLTLKVTPFPTEGSISLDIDKTVSHPEGYCIKSNSLGVEVTAREEAGLFYAVQTIHKALPIVKAGDSAALPAAVVTDFPTYPFRGFLFDVGRHFFSVEYIKEVIDMLALHNINYFHWHLTEDQGWRIEIKKYPKLTQVGSRRAQTIVRPGGEYDGIPVEGFYTQEEAREVVRYAAERFITVIPEVDMPGHMLAALASYPELGCTGGPYEVPCRFGVFEDVLCAGNPKVLKFAKDILNEIMDIFPSEYIHIGGDECPKARWKACQACQAKIRKLGIIASEGRTAEDLLQTWFMGEVEKTIIARGRKMIGWNEILDGEPSKTSIVMAWVGDKCREESVGRGYKTIVAPYTHLYFSNPGYNRLRSVASVARVYNFNPVPESCTPAQQKLIMGVEACLWTEWTKDSTKVEWQILPRMDALCELQWSNPADKNLNAFLGRLKHQLALYDLYGYGYRKDIEEVTVKTQRIEGNGPAVLIELSIYDNAPIHYTMNGEEPTLDSPVYKEPFMGDVSKLKTLIKR